jgi:hypothetical protein
MQQKNQSGGCRMGGTNTTPERQAYDANALSQRWGVSEFTARRLMKTGQLHSITIGSRRLVPLSEVERVERVGCGKPRKSQKVAS